MSNSPPLKSKVSHQILMERVVSNLQEADRKLFQHPEGGFLPIKDWKGLTVNANDEVTGIKWEKLFAHKGSLDFKSLPPTLEHFKASGCQIENTFAFSELPSSLKSLDVEGNYLYGPLHFAHLPKGIEHINLSNNKFVGRAILENLPSSIKKMVLHGNPFESFLLKGDVPSGLSTIMVDKWQERKKVETNLLERSSQAHDVGN